MQLNDNYQGLVSVLNMNKTFPNIIKSLVGIWTLPYFSLNCFFPLSTTWVLPDYSISNIRKKNWVPFVNTCVHPPFFGGVHFVRGFSFLCWASCFVCFRSTYCAPRCPCLWIVQFLIFPSIFCNEYLCTYMLRWLGISVCKNMFIVVGWLPV